MYKCIYLLVTLDKLQSSFAHNLHLAYNRRMYNIDL